MLKDDESSRRSASSRDPLGLLSSIDRPSIPGGRPAVFLDRDGTIIEHVHFLDDPGQVRLLPGAASAIRRLRQAGYTCVVVTNQSGVGRGIIPLERLDAIHDEMNRRLDAEQTAIDAICYSTTAPKTNDPFTIEHPDRKPAPGMLYRAALALNLDLDASWMIGDTMIDVLTGSNARCRGNILVRTGKPFDDSGVDKGLEFHTLDDLPAAADLILSLNESAQGSDVDETIEAKATLNPL